MVSNAATRFAWIGIDIGTRGVRAAAYGNDGRLLIESSVERPPRLNEAGRMTHDPESDWWGGSIAALASLLPALGGVTVAGVGLSGLFPAATLVGPEGIAVSDGILYGDSRAAAEASTVTDTIGVRLSGDEVSPNIVWLRDHEPATMRIATVALGPAGYVGRRLTGADSIDPHSAVRWGFRLTDEHDEWRRDDLVALGLPAHLLPPIRRPSQVIGSTSAEAARLTGLPAGIPVVAGTTDSLAQLLGDGVCMTGDALVYYGSSGTLLVCTVDLDSAIDDPSCFGEGMPYRLAAYAVNSGLFLEQARNELLGGRSYADLDEMAERSPAGANGVFVLPHVSGKLIPVRRPPASGAIVGLSLANTPGDVWRAMLESFGYVLMEAQRDLPELPRSVTAAGGGARSATWRGIVEKMTGWNQRVAPPGGSARGAAALAALGMGGLTSVLDIRDTWVPPVAPTGPGDDEADSHAYAARFERWLQLDRAVAGAAEAANRS